MQIRRLACLSLLVACALLLPTAVPTAQTPAPDPDAPPPLLVIAREVVRIGKNAAHDANEQSWANVLRKAEWPTGWLATSSLTGPNEAWYFTGYPSYDAFAKDSAARDAAEALADARKASALDGDFVANVNVMVARFRPGLSYRATSALGTYRYFTINTVRVKPGFEQEYVERGRELVAAHEKAKMDEQWAVYSVDSGAPAGTFLIIYARKSLAEVDGTQGLHSSPAFREAMGEAGRARMRELTRNAIESSVTNHFAFSPKTSYVPKSWVDADPAFWNVPMPAPAPAKKK
jgi:hypothetical protein